MDGAREAADSRRGCGSPKQVLYAPSKSQAERKGRSCSPAAPQLTLLRAGSRRPKVLTDTC